MDRVGRIGRKNGIARTNRHQDKVGPSLFDADARHRFGFRINGEVKPPLAPVGNRQALSY